jgi:hypothetical protein
MGWFRRTSADEGDAPPSFEDRLAQIGPGVPGRCPACDGLGYIDDIDIGHRYQIQHCKDCLHRWEYLFDADGTVVGLTELDRDGHPVARTRVRPERPAPVLPRPPAPTPEVQLPADEDDVVVDVRDEVVAAPDVDLSEPADLTPAGWLRRSLRR